MRSWPTIFPKPVWVLLILLSFGCGSGDAPLNEGVNPTEGKASNAQPFLPVDFQSKANQELYEGLPSGPQMFNDVTYRIGNQLLQVGSPVFPQFPPRIEGIAVGQTCRAIHFLQSSQGGAYPASGHSKHEDDGVEIGQYIIHYTDGSQVIHPIVYGEDMRGWWDWDNNKPTTRSDLVWTGNNPKAGSNGRRIRFYWAVWENPHPEKSIATIDLVSANKKAAPFCLAMTLETLTQ